MIDLRSALTSAAAWLLLSIAGCELGSLSAGFGSSGGRGGGGGASPSAEGGSTPADGGGSDVATDRAGPSGDVCEGAAFCSTFPGPTLEDWGDHFGYGGGEPPALDTAAPLSLPYALSVKKTLPAEGGSTVTKTVTAAGPIAAAGLSFSFRYAPTSSAKVTLAKVGLGTDATPFTVVVNVDESNLFIETYGSGGNLAKTPAIVADASSAWTRIDIDLVGGTPNRATVRVGGATALTDFDVGAATFGNAFGLELGIVFAPNDSNIQISIDDVAIRVR